MKTYAASVVRININTDVPAEAVAAMGPAAVTRAAETLALTLARNLATQARRTETATGVHIDLELCVLMDPAKVPAGMPATRIVFTVEPGEGQT